MRGSKQTQIFSRKSGQFVDGKVHGIKKMRYDIEINVDIKKI